MIEVKQSKNPLLAYGDDGEIKREEKDAKDMLSRYFGDKDIEVHL